MSVTSRPHRVAVLVLADFVPFDASIPYDVFRQTTLADGRHPYEVFFCGLGPTVRSGAWQLEVAPLSQLRTADTIVVPGLDDALHFKVPAVLQALVQAADEGIRIASICSGAAVLAAAGLLDGLKATTHWALAPALAQAYPRVRVVLDCLYVDNGQMLTSAGLSSGFDLCVYLIGQDYGAAVSARSADFFVMPLARSGDQRQRLKHASEPVDGALSVRLLPILARLHEPQTLASMAAMAHMSVRTLNRKSQEQFGLSPSAWLLAARLRRAQALLEVGTLSIEQVATATGFASAAVFRARFKEALGVTPSAWRQMHASRVAAGLSGAV